MHENALVPLNAACSRPYQEKNVLMLIVSNWKAALISINSKNKKQKKN